MEDFYENKKVTSHCSLFIPLGQRELKMHLFSEKNADGHPLGVSQCDKLKAFPKLIITRPKVY